MAMRAKAWIMAAVLAGVPLASGIVGVDPAGAAGPQDRNVFLAYTVIGLTGTLDVHYDNGVGATDGYADASDGSITLIQFNDRDNLVVRSAGSSLAATIRERVLIPGADDTIRGKASFSGGTVEVSVNSQRPVTVPNGSFSFALSPYRR
jgi:hypothetical protein